MSLSSIITALAVLVVLSVAAMWWGRRGPDPIEDLARTQGWRHVTTDLGWRLEADGWTLNHVRRDMSDKEGAGLVWQTDIAMPADTAAFIARPPPAFLRGLAMDLIKGIAARMMGAEGQAFARCELVPAGVEPFAERFAVVATSPDFVEDWLTFGRQTALLRYAEESGVAPLVSIFDGHLIVRVPGDDPNGEAVVQLTMLGGLLSR